MTPHTFRAFFRDTIKGEPVHVIAERKYRVEGKLDEFLAKQQTPQGRMAFLAEFSEASNPEPIKLSIELFGVEVPVYDLSE